MALAHAAGVMCLTCQLVMEGSRVNTSRRSANGARPRRRAAEAGAGQIPTPDQAARKRHAGQRSLRGEGPRSAAAEAARARWQLADANTAQAARADFKTMLKSSEVRKVGTQFAAAAAWPGTRVAWKESNINLKNINP